MVPGPFFQAFIFLSLISPVFLVASQFFSLPRYDELFYMASPQKGNQEVNGTTQELLSRFYNPEGRNHLEVMTSDASIIRNSEDPLLISRITENIKDLVCNKFTPNVSKDCCADTLEVFKAVLQKEIWAMQMVDSYGKPSSGMIQGNVHFSGSQDECLAADTSIKFGNKKGSSPFHPKYCQVGFPIEAMESLAQMMPEDSIAGILVGICLPDSCHESDIHYLIKTGMHLIPFNLTENIRTVVRCPEELKLDTKAKFSLIFIGILLSFVVVGTLFDILVYRLAKFRKCYPSSKNDTMDEKHPQNTKSESTQFPENNSSKNKNVVAEILLCFSFYKNGLKILNTDISKENLTSIHGIRFISMMWVILGHTYIFGISIWRNLASLQSIFKRFTFQVIANALFSVDTFFMISGMLVTFGILKTLKKQNGKNNWVYFYVHRFWRLTPPYMLVMMVYIPLFQYWGDGPYWPQTGIEINYCHDTWWYNLLYINNFLTDITKGMCMPWTWYLSNDMQFYIISPLLLIPLYKKPRLGIILLLITLIAHCTTAGVISTINGFGPTMFTTTETPVDYFKDIYIKPYTRIGPYLIGMIYGYLLYQCNCRVYINKYIVGIMWLFFSFCALAILYGLYDYNRGIPISQELSSFYTAVARTVWGLSVGWVIYACCTGYGGFVNTILSWKAFIPLSRLTYSTYLVHPIILQSFYLSQRYTIYLTDFEVIYLFFGNLVISFMVGFVTSMVFEAPMIALEALVLRRNKRRKE